MPEGALANSCRSCERYRDVPRLTVRHLLPRSALPIAALLFFTLAPVRGLAADSASPPGPAAAEKDLTVKLPATGEYLVWLEAQTASGPQAQAPVHVTGDRAALPLPAAPAGLKEWRVLALDEKSG